MAYNNVCARRGVLTGTVGQAMAISMPIGVLIFLITTLGIGAMNLVFEFSTTSILWLSVAGIIHFVWGRYCNYRAVKAIGTVLAAPIQQMNLVVALGLAIVFLGEAVTPLKVFGFILVMAGPALAIRKPKAKILPISSAADVEQAAIKVATGGTPIQPAPVFEPKYAEGITFSLLSATGYGVSPLFIRMTLDSDNVSMGVAGGLVSYTAAAFVSSLVYLRPGQFNHALSVGREAAKWFTLSGIFVCLAQMLRYMALSVAPVTVVAPIQRLSLVMRLVLSWFMNREHEVFSVWVFAGIFLSLIGAMALAINTQVVIDNVPLPAVLIEIIKWQWWWQ
jgi:uncharacterized membrane protein